MEYTYQKRMEMLETLKEKFPVLEIIMDINKITRIICELGPSHENDKYHAENFEELKLRLKGLQNTLYGMSATTFNPNIEENNFLLDELIKEPILIANPNPSAMSNASDLSYTIYTNRIITGVTPIKSGLSIIDADEICASANKDIKVPPNQSITEMIGYMWYVPE